MINKPSSPKLHSLRTRAIFFSAVISFFIVVISISGYLNFKELYNSSSENLIKRDQLLVQISLIRNELFDSYKELNSFLLEPQDTKHKKNTLISLDETLRLSNELSKNAWVIKYRRKDISVELNKKLRLLKKEAIQLINIRLDVNNQFPSLAVGAFVMQPNSDKMTSSLSLAMNEMDVENTQLEKPKIFRDLINVRYLWTQILSVSRIYLANRVGSFSVNLLTRQEKSIEDMFNQLQAKLLVLKKSGDAGELGFETTSAVEDMIESSSTWFSGFKEIKVIHHSDEWRKDAKIMKQTISPAIDSIIELLLDLEKIISESSQDDMDSAASFGDSQNKILWLIAFIGIFFTVAVVMSLDKLIFQPIAIISKALKFEALGKTSENLPVVQAKETEDLVNAFNEMSRQVHLRQSELEYRALHDSLTSLPNRTLLLDRIEHDINISKRESQNLCLLILDLDDFKDVNDTLGHLAGDKLLIEVGSRIKYVLRDVDTVARIGGDEFSILLPHTDEAQAIVTCEKVIDSLTKTIAIEGIDVSISASIGISLFPEHGEDVHTLLRHADIAMYVAKRNKLGFEIYNASDDKHSISRLSMTRDFREAMAKNKLTIDYQPIFDFESKKMTAVEALSRWHHPEHGFVSPEKFISLAEQTGLINNLTYWVLDNAISQVAHWNKSAASLSVAVNLSVFSFRDHNFIDEVSSALEKYNFPPEKLKLEITESAMMGNPLQAIEVLTELHDMGIKLAIDDFGTGYSSMAYLKQLPVDELKVDKSFIIGLDQDRSNDAIVRSTIDLAHNLGLKVVAEGIETEVVHDLLRKYKCDMAQGFHLSRPVSAEKLTELL